MARQRSKRLGPAVPALAALGCAFALSLPAAAQDLGDDVFFEEADPFGGGDFGGMDNTASGEIDRVDFSEGRLVIDGRTYRADPRALQGLQPGQQVFLMYEPIEDQAWIRDLQVEGDFYGGDALYGPGF